MKKTFLLVSALLLVVGSYAQTKSQYMQVWVNNRILFEKGIEAIDSITFMEKAVNAESGAIMAPFSVDYGRKVNFSKGNLQYQASTDTWQFAEHQTDAICGANINISFSYDGWIDLFAWGTSGYDNTSEDPLAINYQPWVSGTLSGISEGSGINTFGCGPSANQADVDLVGSSANYDWGVYNAISNGGNQSGLWRTLSKNEWDFLLYVRQNAYNLHALANVEGVHGLILLPDDFSFPDGLTWIGSANDWSSNSYDSSDWMLLEANGAVFLPAAGVRDDPVYGCGSFGLYWTVTADDSHPYYFANALGLSESGLDLQTYAKGGALSVRLVQDVW